MLNYVEKSVLTTIEPFKFQDIFAFSSGFQVDKDATDYYSEEIEIYLSVQTKTDRITIIRFCNNNQANLVARVQSKEKNNELWVANFHDNSLITLTVPRSWLWDRKRYWSENPTCVMPIAEVIIANSLEVYFEVGCKLDVWPAIREVVRNQRLDNTSHLSNQILENAPEMRLFAITKGDIYRETLNQYFGSN